MTSCHSSIAMSFLLLQGTKGPFLVLLSHTFRYCCYAFIGFNKFCLDGHNMLMPFSLTHAEHPSSFSRPMSLCMVTITCMYIHVQSCTFCTCTPAYVTVGLLGVWARGGGGGGRGSCRTNQNGAATGLLFKSLESTMSGA